MMLRRLFIGWVVGLFVGGLVAAGLVAGLGVLTFSGSGGAVLAYATAALTGALTGLVAGKPIWSFGAKVEAGLKALFGALIAAGLMFALRQWAGAWTIPSIPTIGVNGPDAAGNLPAVSLPLLAAILGGFFGVDNTGDSKAADSSARGGVAKDRRRIATEGTKRVKSKEGPMSGADAESDDDAEVVSGGRAKR